MFEIEWLESAVSRLAEAWTEADSLKRSEITQATYLIERSLQIAPQDAGESRAEEWRILIELPLVVTYEVDLPSRKVLVVDVQISTKPGGTRD
jgi:hypothetical protein